MPLLQVLDGAGMPQKISVKGQETVADKSSSITATGVSQKAADANINRAGWLIINQSQNPMGVSDLGTPALLAGAGAIVLAPGEMWPPAGWPLVTTQINVIGTQGDTFIFREW